MEALPQDTCYRQRMFRSRKAHQDSLRYHRRLHGSRRTDAAAVLRIARSLPDCRLDMVVAADSDKAHFQRRPARHWVEAESSCSMGNLAGADSLRSAVVASILLGAPDCMGLERVHIDHHAGHHTGRHICRHTGHRDAHLRDLLPV